MCLAERLRRQKNGNSIPGCLEAVLGKDSSETMVMHCSFPQSCSTLTISIHFFPTLHSFSYHFSFPQGSTRERRLLLFSNLVLFVSFTTTAITRLFLLSEIAGFLRRIPASVEWQSRIRNFENKYLHRYKLSYLMKLPINLRQFCLLLSTCQLQLLTLCGKDGRNPDSDTSIDVIAHIFLLFF